MKQKSNRVKTHIEGLDSLIEGGFIRGSTNTIIGSCATGKTIFSMQYLYNGVKKDNEKCIYFTFEEKKESLIKQAIQFGWDLNELEKKGRLKIISIGVTDINKNTVKDIIEIIKDVKAKRVVIDSISTLAFLTPKDSSIQSSLSTVDVKRFIYEFITKFRELEDVTSLLISQKDNEGIDEVVKYICDGVIEIEYESLGGDFSRNLNIRKMRKTKNDDDLHPMEISSKQGIIIHNLD